MQIIRIAFRSLARDWTFTLFSALSLALGLGLNASLLVLTRTFLLRPAPVSHPESLMEIRDVPTFPGSPWGKKGSTTAFDLLQRRPELGLTALADAPRRQHWSVGATAGETLNVQAVSDAYLKTLGVQPHLGRDLEPGESGSAAAAPVVLIGHALWQKLGGDAHVLGAPLHVGGMARQIIGVLPKGFLGHRLDQRVEAWVPARYEVLDSEIPARMEADILLRPSGPPEGFHHRLMGVAYSSTWRLEAHPYQPLPEALHTSLTRGLGMLHVATLLVLAIGLANALALQLARWKRREPDWAVHVALGARPIQLFKRLLAEQLVLSLGSGLLALGLASLAKPFQSALQALIPYPVAVPIALGPWTAGITLLLSFLVGLLMAGLAARDILKSPSRPGLTAARGVRLRSILVAGQAALTLTLLGSALVCLKEVRRALNVPLGFALEDRFLVRINAEKSPDSLDRLKAACLTMPELHVARSHGMPLDERLGLGLAPGKPRVDLLCGEADLARTLGLRLREGRLLEAGDLDRDRSLVSASFARLEWPGESALGRRWSAFGGKTFEVVGVVEDARLSGPYQPEGPFALLPTAYAEPFFQQPHNRLLIHAPGKRQDQMQALVDTVLGPQAPRVMPLKALRDEAMVQPRQLLVLATLMGSLALVLSLCGLYGLATHLARQKTHELGIRAALGASPMRLLGLLGRSSVLPILPGLVFGLVLAHLSGRWLQTFQHMPALDPTQATGVALLLAFVSALAVLPSALGAALRSPADVLRRE